MVACKKCRVEVTIFEYANVFGDDLCISCIERFVDKLFGRLKINLVTSTQKTRRSPHQAWKMVVEKHKHSLVNFYMPTVSKSDIADYQKILAQEIQRSQHGLQEGEKVWNSKTRAIRIAGENRARKVKKILDGHPEGVFCYYCNLRLDTNTYTTDHVIPTSKGGSRKIENMVPACFKCNSEKSDSLNWHKGCKMKGGTQ